MKFKITLIFTAMLSILSCSKAPLETVGQVDIQEYSGTWYEITRLPNSFEKGLKCVTATYTLKDNGKIKVENKGVRSDGKVSDIEGTAWQPSSDHPGRLKVRFFWPFSGDYYIMKLADDYSYALVGSPSRKFLWVLSRTVNMEDETISSLLGYAKENGFATDKMEMIQHDCK